MKKVYWINVLLAFDKPGLSTDNVGYELEK